jgi:tetratricopeptide (TPR) repeat protein
VASAETASAPRPRARGSSYDKLVASGNRLLEDGQSDQAQAQFEKARAERPDGADALIGLAYVQLARGAGPKAVGLFKQVLEHDAGYAPALLGLGEAYREQGMRAGAIGAFKKFLALHPSGADAETARRAIQDLAAGR